MHKELQKDKPKMSWQVNFTERNIERYILHTVYILKWLPTLWSLIKKWQKLDVIHSIKYITHNTHC